MGNITNEGGVKEEVKKILNKTPECWWYMPVQTGYGVHGIPDFVVCVRGIFLAIETKFGRNELSPWQKRQEKSIGKAGGYYLVIVEHNIPTLEDFLRNIPQ